MTNFALQPWYWLVLGMILIALELVIPSFTIIWFGCAAIVVAGLGWIFPNLSETIQIFSWAIASIFFTAVWFLFFKPKMVDKTKAGISLESVLGASGLVIRVPHGKIRGLVKFTTPLLGEEEWQFFCDDSVSVGDKVRVADVSGNTLIVRKISEVQK